MKKRYILVLAVLGIVVACGFVVIAAGAVGFTFWRLSASAIEPITVATNVPVIVNATKVPKLNPTNTRPVYTPTEYALISHVGKWAIVRDASSFDDSEIVTLQLKADKKIEGWLKESLPSLILRCKEGELDAYIVVGMSQDVEYGETDESTVRLRFDKDDALTMKMGHSTDGDALFFYDAPSIIGEMEQHQRMIFGFTPFNASPVETSFDLTDLPRAADNLWVGCAGNGQRLTPIAPQPSATNFPKWIGPIELYTVHEGDTIFSIAQARGVDIQVIFLLNNWNSSDVEIRAGDLIFVPTTQVIATPTP